MNHNQSETEPNLFAVEEALKAVSEKEDDLEWKQFIQSELGKLDIQVNNEGKDGSERTSSAGANLNLSTLIDKLPLEKLVVKVVGIVKTTMEQRKAESASAESEKAKSKKIKAEKTKSEKAKSEKTKPEKNRNKESRNERIRKRKVRRENRIEKTEI